MSYFVLPAKSTDATNTLTRHTLNNTLIDKSYTIQYNNTNYIDAIASQLQQTNLGQTYLPNITSRLNNTNTITPSSTQRLQLSPYASNGNITKNPSRSHKHKPSQFKVNRYSNDGFFGPECKLDGTAERQRLRQQQQIQYNNNNQYNNKSKSISKSVTRHANRIYNIKSPKAATTTLKPSISARQHLLNYLTSTECQLFIDAINIIAVSDQDIDHLIEQYGGSDSVQTILDKIKLYNQSQKRYQAWSDLVYDICNLLSPSVQQQQNSIQYEKHTDNTDVLSLESSRPNTQPNSHNQPITHKRADTGIVNELSGNHNNIGHTSNLAQLTEETDEYDADSFVQ